MDPDVDIEVIPQLHPVDGIFAGADVVMGTSHRPLPPFTIRGFTKSLIDGTWVKERVEAERRREMERIHAEKRRRREEETAMWTTPGLRPLAEPPILEWDNFFRRNIPSDLRYRALFPNDPEMRAKAKDLDGERYALINFRQWAEGMIENPADDSRRKFYEALESDVKEDLLGPDGVGPEYGKEVWQKATSLGCFEYSFLDNDLRTTKMEKAVEKGADIFGAFGDVLEVHAKYDYLVPPDFVEDRLATFEYEWAKEGDTSALEDALIEGNDILSKSRYADERIQAKYGSLRYLLPSVEGGLPA